MYPLFIERQLRSPISSSGQEVIYPDLVSPNFMKTCNPDVRICIYICRNAPFVHVCVCVCVCVCARTCARMHAGVPVCICYLQAVLAVLKVRVVPVVLALLVDPLSRALPEVHGLRALPWVLANQMVQRDPQALVDPGKSNTPLDVQLITRIQILNFDPNFNFAHGFLNS